MLGCHDFCGHYEWTFHYVRRRWGRAAIELLWRDIGSDSQQHYVDAGLRAGLRGLYEVWTATGQDEHCDWTFTLDEEKNVLRWDMRQCPSKGFLVQNDLAADEDYCDHCMGWAIPMLESIGAEIVEHEHNHCGQCWATMRMKDRPTQPLDLGVDIRKDPRWNRGCLDRWADNRQLPLLPQASLSSDACEALEAWFHGAEAVVLLDEAISAAQAVPPSPTVAMIASDTAYNDRSRCPTEPRAVLIGCPPADLMATAARWRAAGAERPLLLHAFLPGLPFVDFLAAGLPRPLPILPLVIRRGLYTHQPGGPHPTTAAFLNMLGAALGK